MASGKICSSQLFLVGLLCLAVLSVEGNVVFHSRSIIFEQLFYTTVLDKDVKIIDSCSVKKTSFRWSLGPLLPLPRTVLQIPWLLRPLCGSRIRSNRREMYEQERLPRQLLLLYPYVTIFVILNFAHRSSAKFGRCSYSFKNKRKMLCSMYLRIFCYSLSLSP